LVASGGGFHQPGLLDYLSARGGLQLRPWPAGGSAQFPQPREGFEVAYGAVLQALGQSAQPVSLLPQDYQIAWRKRAGRQRLEFASLVLALICALIFLIGTWHNFSVINRKQALLAKVQAGQDSVEANESLTGDLLAEYEALRPMFAAAQNTIDTLQTLSLLQQSRSNRSCWYVLIADQQSYFTLPLTLNSTNTPGKTNLVASTAASSPFGPAGNSWTLQNYPLPARPGFIAELCIPEEAETARRSLDQIVGELQQKRLFLRADLLSEDLRRALADPKVVIPERQFVLHLDFAETEFLKAASGKRISGASPSRGPKRQRGTTNPSEASE
jgi:hypothetical protein